MNEFKEIYKKRVISCLDAKQFNNGKTLLDDMIAIYDADINYQKANYLELVKCTKRMRELQIEYFKNRSVDVLKLCKQYEELTDKVLYLINDKN